MKKETWNILGAVIAILFVCLAMAYMSGCDDEPELEFQSEVGQVWGDEPSEDGVDFVWIDDWPDEPTESILIDASDTIDGITIIECDKCQFPDDGNVHICPGHEDETEAIVEEEGESEIIWISDVGEATDIFFCVGSVEVRFTWNDGKFDVIYDANDLTRAAETFFVSIKPYLNAHIKDAAENLTNRKGMEQ